GGEGFERRDRTLGDRDASRGTLPVVRRQRFAGGSRSGGQLCHVTEPLSLGPKRVLVLGLHPEGVLDQRSQLGQSRLGGVGPTLQLFMPAPRGLQLSPGNTGRGAAPQLLVAAECVEHVQLIGGSREAPLL